MKYLRRKPAILTVLSVVTVLLGYFFYAFSEGLSGTAQSRCTIVSSKEIASPANKWHLSEAITKCSTQPKTISLFLEDPDMTDSVVVVIRVPAFQARAHDQAAFPVALQYRWQSDSELEIWYPKGLQTFLWPGKAETIDLRDLRFSKGLFFGLQIKLREGAP